MCKNIVAVELFLHTAKLFCTKNAKVKKLLLPLFHYKFSWVHICSAKETIECFALVVTALTCVLACVFRSLYLRQNVYGKSCINAGMILFHVKKRHCCPCVHAEEHGWKQKTATIKHALCAVQYNEPHKTLRLFLPWLLNVEAYVQRNHTRPRPPAPFSPPTAHN